MSKIAEKRVVEQFSQYYEAHSKLHSGQIGARKERLAIDAIATLVNTVQGS